MITTYKVEVTRAQRAGKGHWWMISVPEIDRLTQARRLEDVEQNARELIAVTLDVELDEIAVEVSEVIDTWAPQRSVRVPENLWQAVKAKAKAEGETIAAVIIRALRRYVGWDDES